MEEHGKLLQQLEADLAALGPLAVAVSGGVDSMTLARAAHRVNAATTMFHALSPAVPAAATARVRDFAEKYQWRLELIDAGEMGDPRYLKNPVNRCYYCKTNLYAAIAGFTPAQIVSGTNTDDLADFRPGLQAAAEAGVRHPFVEAGIGKAAIRWIARRLGLDEVAELPASPCLSSRVTTGIPIDATLLPLIDITENRVRDILNPEGGGNVRCRVRGGMLAVEVDAGNPMAEQSGVREAVRRQVKTVFADSSFRELGEHVRFAAYKKGSAFVGGKEDP